MNEHADEVRLPEMAREPERSVPTLFAAGFADQFYFSRVFRKRRGLPPGEYRDKMRAARTGGQGATL